MKIVAETHRLRFCEVELSDVPQFLEYMRNPGYVQYVPFEMQTFDSLKIRMQKFIDEQRAEPRSLHYFAVRPKNDPNIIGEGVLRKSDPQSQEAEIGWAVHDKHWRQGWGFEIGQTLLSYGFDQLNLHRLFARAAPENKASLRIIEKLGMISEGLVREIVFSRGKWWSFQQSSILENEWSERKHR
jgi:RimJ/RimL family protein N-acetyltransferase